MYHQGFTAHAYDWNWTLPRFLLSWPPPRFVWPDSQRIDEDAKMLPELFPFYNGTTWSLQATEFSKGIEYDVGRYLAGLDDMEEEASDMYS